MILARAPFLPILAGLMVMLALYERVVLWVLPLIALITALGIMISSFCENEKKEDENEDKCEDKDENNNEKNNRIKKLKSYCYIMIFVLICLFISSLWIIFSLNKRNQSLHYSSFSSNFIKTIGTVTEVRPWGRLYAAAVQTPEGGFVLKLPFATLTEGDKIRLEGNTKPFSSGSPGSDFREDRFWMARGMTALLTSVKTKPFDYNHNNHANFIFNINIHRWRYDLYRFLSIYMPNLTGSYLNAAWTGKRDPELNNAHRTWGTSHILAVSGFHVGVVMAGVSFLFKRGKLRVLILSLILWFYILLTGAPASAVRAGLMIQIELAGELAGRPGSAINSVSLAAVILLLCSPFWFWDIGWRLSVLAALAVATTLERWRGFGWKTLFFMNSMIWFASFPQISWTFNSAPLAGIFINLIAPQFFGIALTTASIAAALFMLGVPMSSYLLLAVEGIFILWGILSDIVVRMLPWQMSWNPIISYCCAVLFITFMCRALFVPWRNIAVLAPLGALSAFILFSF